MAIETPSTINYFAQMKAPSTWILPSTTASSEPFCHATAAYAISAPALTWVDRDDRVFLEFEAAGEALLNNAGLELRGATAYLLAPDHTLLGFRECGYAGRRMLGSRCAWTHEFTPSQKKLAVAVVYVLEARIEYRSVFLTGTVMPFTIGTDKAELLQISTTAQNQQMLETEVEIRLRRNDLEIAIAAATGIAHDGFRADLAVSFLDEDGILATVRNINIQMKGMSSFCVHETGFSVERKIAESIRSLSISGRIEVNLLDTLILRLPT